MDIKIQDYLSYDEIRDIIIEETRNFAKNELNKFKEQEKENQDIIKEKVKLTLENFDYKDLILRDLLTFYNGE